MFIPVPGAARLVPAFLLATALAAGCGSRAGVVATNPRPAAISSAADSAAAPGATPSAGTAATASSTRSSATAGPGPARTPDPDAALLRQIDSALGSADQAISDATNDLNTKGE